MIFNYGRNEVRSFLVSSVAFWLDRYHADGLRVDGVASMLYSLLENAANVPNEHGGRENLAAIAFLRQLNETLYERFPGVQTIAEESTAWPMVSRPTYLGGLGFGFKWDMGWMHDTLEYFGRDPVHRRWHHHDLTFRMVYAFTENFELPLSHDEVVHGKGSLLSRMPGDQWQRLANLRLLLGSMTAAPGKKLLFMGAELGQVAEWDHDGELDWGLLDDPGHAGVSRWVTDCNDRYRRLPALHDLDCEAAGFEWVLADAAEDSVIAFLRKGRDPDDLVLVVANHTPAPREAYRVGVPRAGFWREELNSDAEAYGGAGWGTWVAWTPRPRPSTVGPSRCRSRSRPSACCSSAGSARLAVELVGPRPQVRTRGAARSMRGLPPAGRRRPRTVGPSGPGRRCRRPTARAPPAGPTATGCPCRRRGR